MTMAITRGSKVRWTEAHEGTWAKDGRGIVKDVDPRRAYFEGHSEGNAKEPPRGFAVLVFIHDDPMRDVWVPPSELMPDLEPDKPYDQHAFLREEPAEAYEAP